MKNMYKNCVLCGIEKKSLSRMYCIPCDKEKYKYKELKKLNKLLKEETRNKEIYLFVEEMMYRKRFFFDIVDIFRMIDYWLVIKKGGNYDELDVEEQLERYWKDLIFFYSDMRKNGNFKGSVKNDVF